ncbi:MAG: hypothetical protein HC836_23505 [Richelia sp. RM2_1_2]|nr:hypothetical protein [Richelia sp. SM2_1_7]NJM17740.1 hypothetical protein [Richelia sp. SM1_7_0]NJN08236.1 hypothetical protein [Richelia sp. RM1_1_1]NJO61119.1 hypothetical protein [Richelia sp. RM2_1_2]
MVGNRDAAHRCSQRCLTTNPSWDLTIYYAAIAIMFSPFVKPLERYL